jgi:acylphosphatase
MNFDLTIEVVVEGDDQALKYFQDMLEVEQQHDDEHVVPNVEPTVEIDLMLQQV